MENITLTDSIRQTHVMGPSTDNADLFFFTHKDTVCFEPLEQCQRVN